MTPRENVQSSVKEIKPGSKRSMLRRWLFQFYRRIGTCCGRLDQVPDELELRGQHLRRCTETPETFQQFLRERKLEMKQEAEQRIAAMKSTTGIHPLELFPTEIWLKILKYFEPEGLANMLEIHDLFPDLVLEEHDLIQDILLPLMLDFKFPIVQKHLLPADLDRYRRSRKRDGLWPLIVLRRVCKSFQDAIDRWIENRLLHLMRTSEFIERVDTSLAIDELKHFQLDICYSWERMSKVLEYSRGPVAEMPKRFVLRSLNIAFNCNSCYWDWDGCSKYDDLSNVHGRQLPERFPIFKDNITEFLRTVGDQIMHISLVLPRASRLVRFGVPLSQVDIYDIARVWLSLVPNLRWLQINASVVDPPLDSDVTREMRRAPIPIPMPSLRNMERFDFQGCVEEVPIWHAILAANPQISRINVLHSWPPGGSGSNEHGRHRALCKAEIDVYKDPAVLALPLEVAHFGRKCYTGWDFRILMPIRAHDWNLKRLTLWICGGMRFSMRDVFQCLESFQTLEDVRIRIVIGCRNVKIGENFLLLPNLKRFKIELRASWELKSPAEADFLFSLMFLLECKKLESLFWVNDWDDSKSLWCQLKQSKESMLISFMGGFEDLCESNVWDVFPKLRTITVRSCFYPYGFGIEKEYLVRKYYDRELIGEKKVECRDGWYVDKYACNSQVLKKTNVQLKQLNKNK